MPGTRGSRFLVEVLFLVGLAVALTLANLTPIEIAGVMALGWVIVALLEWAAWREEPHYGSGLPPRYYVPQVNLPPAQPLEQVAAGYPESHREEAPTWIASAELREEMLGGWPVAAPPVVESPIELDAPPALQLEPDDPWVVAELPAPPVSEAPPPEPEPVAMPLPEPAPAAAAVEPPQLDVVLVRSLHAHAVARYSLDPLADPPPKKRFGRSGQDETPAVEVPARPDARALPGATRQD
jgi:hypothetical protein